MKKLANESWEQLGSDRLICKRDLGYLLIKPILPTDRIPLECPVCSYLLQDQRDVNNYRIYQCCNECALIWAEANRDQWKEGWRPALEDIEIQLAKRFQTPIYQAN